MAARGMCEALEIGGTVGTPSTQPSDGRTLTLIVAGLAAEVSTRARAF